jgi:hypothetical protein
MRFSYALLPGGHLRPIIPVRITVGNRWINYELLVNSSADNCILNAELARHLGLDVRRGEEATMLDAAGQLQTIYFHRVQMSIGPHSYGARVAFTETDVPYGLGGQGGLFSEFYVSFDHQAQALELTPHHH